VKTLALVSSLLALACFTPLGCSSGNTGFYGGDAGEGGTAPTGDGGLTPTPPPDGGATEDAEPKPTEFTPVFTLSLEGSAPLAGTAIKTTKDANGTVIAAHFSGKTPVSDIHDFTLGWKAGQLGPGTCTAGQRVVELLYQTPIGQFYARSPQASGGASCTFTITTDADGILEGTASGTVKDDGSESLANTFQFSVKWKLPVK
jgi:hypothetical protein